MPATLAARPHWLATKNKNGQAPSLSSRLPLSKFLRLDRHSLPSALVPVRRLGFVSLRLFRQHLVRVVFQRLRLGQVAQRLLDLRVPIGIRQ